MSTSAALMQELAECVCSTAALKGSGPLCECLVLPGGTPPGDYCGGECGRDCGSGFVIPVNVSPYTSFGLPGALQQSCATPLQMTALVGIMRCLHIPEDGTPLTGAEQAEVAYMLDLDMHAIREAVLCCFTGDALLMEYQPIAADGGCIGGAWTVVLDLG